MGVLAAVILCCLITAVLVGTSYRDNQWRTADCTEQSASEQTTQSGDIVPGTQHGATLAPHNNLSPTPCDQTYYNREDLKAQRQMALWTRLMGAAAIVGIAISVVGIGLVYTTFAETRKANEIARAALANSNRAWLQLEVGPFVTFFEHTNENSVSLQIDTAANNFGQEPATFVSREIVYVHAPGPFHLESEIRRLAAKRDWRSHHGETIYAEKKKRIDGDVRCLIPVLPPVGVGEPWNISVPQNYIGAAMFYSSGAGDRIYYVARFFRLSEKWRDEEIYRVFPIGGECHGEVPLRR